MRRFSLKLQLVIFSSILGGCSGEVFISKPPVQQDQLLAPKNSDVHSEPPPPDLPDETIVPPNNVSGTYLIGCEPQTLSSSSPVQLQLTCQVKRAGDSALTARGMWAAQLQSPRPGEAVELSDASQGIFILSLLNKNSADSMLSRTLISFAGEVDGQDLSLASKATDTFDSGSNRFKEWLSSLGEETSSDKTTETKPAANPQPPASNSLCPPFYVPVPADGRYATATFCVMKYEAKNSAGSPAALSAPSPWVSISQAIARSSCQALGPKYDLITNEEWMALTINIAGVASNWSSGVVGQGVMNTGHSDNNPSMPCPAASDDQLGYVEGDCTGLSSGNFSQRRTHQLSNGSTIWDVAGNAWELTRTIVPATSPKPFSTIDQVPVDAWRELTMIDTGLNILPQNKLRPLQAEIAFWNDTWTSKVGTGQYFAGSNAGGALQRGGSWSDQINSGLFATGLNLSSSTSSELTGFRCVYRP